MLKAHSHDRCKAARNHHSLNTTTMSYSLLLLFIACETAFGANPYKVLGVENSASQPEIRSTYKQLVREWHPDKTKDNDDNGVRFMEIQKAYELLSDPDRRRRFDEKGITAEDVSPTMDAGDENYHKPGDHNFKTHFFWGDTLEEFLDHHQNRQKDAEYLRKLRVTASHYDKVIVPQSGKTPHLLLFYTDWCPPCVQMVPYYQKLMDYLEPLGVKLFTVHATREPQLVRRLNIHSLPSLVLILDGSGSVYKETLTNMQKIIEFIRSRLPYKIVETVSDETVETFLQQWPDNRVRALIFQSKDVTRLRYLLVAYQFRSTVAFGHVLSSILRATFRVPLDMDAVLLFNENCTNPIATIAMKDIPSATLKNVITSNQYLSLPRLSSQDMLDAICPCEWHQHRRKLCILLLITTPMINDSNTRQFRAVAQKWTQQSQWIRFAYILTDKQTDFVDALIKASNATLSVHYRIVIIWRRDVKRVKFEWTKSRWDLNTENLNDTVEELENTINDLVKNHVSFSHEAIVKELRNEHSKSLLRRILIKTSMILHQLFSNLSKEQILPIVSVLGTVVFLLIIGYSMAYLVRVEEEAIQKEKELKSMSSNNGADKKTVHNKNNHDSNSSANIYQPELRIHEMRAEKYNALVRLLKPGCRTIVLLLDSNTKHTLIPPFHKALWSYRKNKSLLFAYLNVERGLNWYKQLLELSIPNCWELKINPKNCVGTVLSVNGYRKYFCMFHVKYNEQKKKTKSLTTTSTSTSNSNSISCSSSSKKLGKLQSECVDCESGSFIGFHSDTSESDEDIYLHTNDLLDGLSNWLDRLFEGTTKRYYINYWPDFPYK